MEPATIRRADPHTDTAACLAIYAPYVESGATSFEEEPRDVGWWQLGLRPPGEGKPAEPLPPEP